MPESKQFADTQLNYWHTLSEVMKDSKFDVVETTLPLVATLLPALTRETATVVRIEEELSNSESNFDAIFQNLIVNYALSCADAYSAHQSNMANVDSQRICINSESSASQLALRAMQIYETAIDGYKNVDRPDLYRHGSERLIKSTEDMMALYDQMLSRPAFPCLLPVSRHALVALAAVLILKISRQNCGKKLSSRP